MGQAGCVGGFVRVWSALPLQVYADHNVLQSIGVRPGGIAFALLKELTWREQQSLRCQAEEGATEVDLKALHEQLTDRTRSAKLLSFVLH